MVWHRGSAGADSEEPGAAARSADSAGYPEKLSYDRERRTAGRRLPARRKPSRERKVRTPQGSVPDNVRDRGVKAARRPVPQRKYRPHLARGAGKGEKVR